MPGKQKKRLYSKIFLIFSISWKPDGGEISEKKDKRFSWKSCKPDGGKYENQDISLEKVAISSNPDRAIQKLFGKKRDYWGIARDLSLA